MGYKLSFAQERFFQYLMDEKWTIKDFSEHFNLDYQKIKRFKNTGHASVELQRKLCQILYLENDFVNYAC